MRNRRLRPTFLCRCAGIGMLLVLIWMLLTVTGLWSDPDNTQNIVPLNSLAVVITALLSSIGINELLVFGLRLIAERTTNPPSKVLFVNIDQQHDRQCEAAYKATESNPTLR